MAINDKDFYASHGLDFDYKNMLDEYIKGVINQAKIEVLTELQTEIEKVPKYHMTHNGICVYREAEEYISDINKVIQQKINLLKENEKDGTEKSTTQNKA